MSRPNTSHHINDMNPRLQNVSNMEQYLCINDIDYLSPASLMSLFVCLIDKQAIVCNCQMWVKSIMESARAFPKAHVRSHHVTGEGRRQEVT